MENLTPTFEDILKEDEFPAVVIDHHGLFIFLNDAFLKAYGWEKNDLLGKPISLIIPTYMRDSHNIGFSRFLSTESPRILGKTLQLPVLCKDETIKQAEHYIIGEKKENGWQFAATIKLIST